MIQSFYRKRLFNVLMMVTALFSYKLSLADEVITEKKQVDNNLDVNCKKTILSSNQDIIIEEDPLFMISEDPSFLSFYIDYGLSFFGYNDNSELSTGAFSSRALSLALSYNMVIPNSYFAILLGAGYLHSTLSFDSEDGNYYTFSRDFDRKTTEIVGVKELVKTSRPIKDFNGSYLNRHYIEFLLGTKCFFDKFYPKDSFSIYFGFKFGILVSSNIEIVYGQDQIAKTLLFKDSFNLKDLKIGATAKFAWRRFGLFYDIDFTDTFASLDDSLQGPDMKYLQKIGIFVDLF